MTISYEFNELLTAAKELRAAQKDYLSDPIGSRSQAKGQKVGEAAEHLDRAIEIVENLYG